MGKIKRKFDIQFKIQICQAIESGVTQVLNVCREYQLQRSLVEGWLAKYVSGSLESQSPTRAKQLEREVEKLKAKVGELTMTIDLLKKVEDWRRPPRSVGSSIVTASNLAQFLPPAEPSGSRSRASTTAVVKTRA